jgi:hypothetical protein
MEEENQSIKQIRLPDGERKDDQSAKTPRKKIASQNGDWITTAETYSTQESQINLLLELRKEITSDDMTIGATILLSHLKTKQSGYRSQDTLKGFYDPDRFIQIGDIVNLLIDSGLSCFYCRKWATLFYENVRHPMQWSLERVSNEEGHNRGNIVIACLDCNMRRRTMYQDRYIVTKQLRVNKLS